MKIFHVSSFHLAKVSNLKGKHASLYFQQKTTPRLVPDIFYTTIPPRGSQAYPQSLYLIYIQVRPHGGPMTSAPS